MLTHSFEHGDDVAVLAGFRMDARQDGAAVNEDRGTVEASHGHDAPWHVLVAAADSHQGVEALRATDSLDGVSDDLARHQRIAHSKRPHADAVRHRDRAENDRLAPGGVHPGARFPRERVDVHVARCEHAPGRGDADDRFLEVGVLESDGAQHGAVGGAVGAVVNDGGVFPEQVGLGHDEIRGRESSAETPKAGRGRR